MMRDFASLLLRWLTVTACGSMFFRRDETEFPVASQNACNLLKRTFQGSRAADSAPSDALRLFNNRLNIQDQHELSIIRQTLAPLARRIPPKGRSPSAPAARGRESSQENILAAARCFFWRQQKCKATYRSLAQWLAAATAAGAQT
jgi:hypothetical protein